MSVENAVPVSVVIPTFRRPDALRSALSSLLALDYPAELLEFIVVDDEGEGLAVEVVDSMSIGTHSVRIESQRRRGAAAARNHGARVSTGELLLFLDDDILVAADHVERHLDVRQSFGDPLVNGAWQFSPDVMDRLGATPFGRFRIDLERRFQEEAAGEPLDANRLEMAMLGTWDLAIRRGLFWDLGGFDEGFPVAGAEDQDFSLRAREAGCLLVLDRSIICLHNDNRLDLVSYCAREERSALTMPLLARKYPEKFGDAPYVRENRPIRVTDPPRLIVKKTLKKILSREPCLMMLRGLVYASERLGVPESMLARTYRLLLGLHLFRGVQSAWPR